MKKVGEACQKISNKVSKETNLDAAQALLDPSPKIYHLKWKRLLLFSRGVRYIGLERPAETEPKNGSSVC